MSDLQKEKWKDPVRRKNMSDLQKEKWKDPAYREKSIKGINKWIADHPEFSAVLSQRNKEKWKDPVYRKHISECSSKQIIEQWKDPKFQEIQSIRAQKSLKSMWSREDHRKHISECTSKQVTEQWKDPIFRAMMIKNSSAANRNKIWANNGFENLRLNSQDPIPVGYYRGRFIPAKQRGNEYE
ncbi:MAG TPA: hypothetical protein VIJ14_06320, partial [Rhabdochlamydiaceae bacterium]